MSIISSWQNGTNTLIFQGQVPEVADCTPLKICWQELGPVASRRGDWGMCADWKPELRHGGFDCWEDEGRIDTGDYLADLTVKENIFFF